ncbi:MAG: hypothetical protein ABI787_01465 [Spartobacteria bacterium]
MPLQRSIFGLTASAATTIALPGLSSALDFPARLDENGDLFLDRSKVAALTKILLAWFTPENLHVMQTTHAAACASLVHASENAARVATSLDGASAKKLSEDLAGKLTLVMVYGILSKFVPDVLLRALADVGDTEPPAFPEKSAGSGLLQDTLTLYQACCALGYPPQRLRHEWPRVSPEVFHLLGEFCQRQRGFGPLAWDSPGYEDPNYVVRLLHSAFHEVDVERVRQRFSFAGKPAVTHSADAPKEVAALRRVLGFWLDFLERETWYVRRAFYIGMIPLLRQMEEEFRQKVPNFQLMDLLFLDIRELAAGIAEPAVIHERRQRYLDNTEYLSLHGVDARRVATMLGKS